MFLSFAAFTVVAPVATVANSLGILLDQDKRTPTVALILSAGAATGMASAMFWLLLLLPHVSAG